MRVSLVVAMAENRVIGRDNGLPWHLPADLARFKAVTLGHPVVMGRRTFESIGRPLPGRENIVITRQTRFPAHGCTVVSSFEAAVAAAGNAEQVMVIGGAQIFEIALPRADRIFLTVVHTWPSGDVRFPDLDSEVWVEQEREERPPDARNASAMSFLLLARKSKTS